MEILSQCPTHYGRKNKEGDAPDMLQIYKDTTGKLGSKTLEKNPELIPRGIFVQEERGEYCEDYEKLVQGAMGGAR